MRHVRLFFIAAFIFLDIIAYPQPGTWIWIRGDSFPNSLGKFGIQGIPSPYNDPPGRYACGYWTDTSENFWVYSGTYYNDLWKFDPLTSMWTWMQGDTIELASKKVITGKGIYNILNSPGSLEFGMFTWVTTDNHLWLFGGHPINSANLNNDLWQYNPAINQWAWMGTYGPPNYGTKGVRDTSSMPGGRYEGNCAWTDNNGNLWLFGGFDSLDRSYNDVWEYNVATSIWNWMSGSSNLNDAGNYGTIGQPSVNNYPSARSTNLFWKDEQGNFWLAGGTQSSITSEIMFQDIWKFNPQTLEWTWVKGLEGIDTETIGTNCSADTLDKDGPRYENRAVWKLSDDLIATCNGFPNWNVGSEANDLWAYKVNSNEWLKINEWPLEGSYGVQGVADAGNYPTSRFGSVGFKDSESNFWMFAGQGNFNDLWKYVPDTACIGALTTGVQQVQEEEQVLLYPNPCCASLPAGQAGVQLSVSSNLIGSALQVYNAEGQIVFQSAIRAPQSQISISGLPAGIYFLQIASPNGSVVRKLVKM